MIGGIDQNFMQSLMQQMGKYRTGIDQQNPIGTTPDMVGMSQQQAGAPMAMPVGGDAAVAGSLPPNAGAGYPPMYGMQGGQGAPGGGMNMQSLMPLIQMFMKQGQGGGGGMTPPGPTQGLRMPAALAPRGYRGGV